MLKSSSSSSPPASSSLMNRFHHPYLPPATVSVTTTTTTSQLPATADLFPVRQSPEPLSRMSSPAEPPSSSTSHIKTETELEDLEEEGEEVETTSSSLAAEGRHSKGKRGRPRKHAPKIPLPPLYVFIRNLLHNQGWKFMSCSHCQKMCQQTSWLLIGCSSVNN